MPSPADKNQPAREANRQEDQEKLIHPGTRSAFLVSVDRFIPVEPQTLFDIVADPTLHPVIDGSGTVHADTGNNPDRLFLGATFAMGMRIAAKYEMRNTVTEFEEGRRIAWRPRGDYTWRYLFTPVDGGTLVTEQWDARDSKRRIIMRLLGFPARNRRGIEATLERLALHATGIES